MFEGHTLRKRRQALGLTATAVANAAGLHPKTVQRFERGVGTLSYTSALAIAFVLLCREVWIGGRS